MKSSKSINRTNTSNTLFLYIGTFFVVIASISGVLILVGLLTKVSGNF